MDAENWDDLLSACPHRALVTDRACGNLPLWWPLSDTEATFAVIAWLDADAITFAPLDRGEIIARLHAGETLLIAALDRGVVTSALSAIALALATPVGTA